MQEVPIGNASLDVEGEPSTSSRGERGGWAWWMSKDVSAGNGKSRAHNHMHDWWHSFRNRKRIKSVILTLPYGVVLFLVVWMVVRWSTWTSGHLILHLDEGTVEFVPVAGDYLSAYQTASLKEMAPYRAISEEELALGHAHVRVPHPGVFPALDDSPSSRRRRGEEVTVDLRVLQRALEEHCELMTCSCTSAPHLGVPLRAVHTKHTGMMLNPILVYTGTLVEGAHYSSVLGDYDGPLPLEVRVDYIGPLLLEEVNPRRKRTFLSGSVAACVYATVTAEFDHTPLYGGR